MSILNIHGTTDGLPTACSSPSVPRPVLDAPR